MNEAPGLKEQVNSDDVIFEWDARKAAANLKKHAVAFEDPASAANGFASLARAGRHEPSEGNMKRGSPGKDSSGLRDEYDLSQLKGGVRGKYYDRVSPGTNLVLIEPDLARIFPDSESVNRALRLLAETAKATTTPKRRRSG